MSERRVVLCVVGLRLAVAAALLLVPGCAASGQDEHEKAFEEWASRKRPGEEHTDSLRPEEEKLRRAYFGMLEEMREKKITPRVSVRTKRVRLLFSHDPGYTTRYRYTIRIPEKYRSIDKQHFRHNRLAYSYRALDKEAIRDPEFAFYAVLSSSRCPKQTTWRLRSLPFLEAVSPADAFKQRFEEYVTEFAPDHPYIDYRRHLDQHFRVLERLDPTGRTRLERPTGGYDSLGTRWTLPDYRQDLEKRDRAKPVPNYYVITARTGDAIVEADIPKRAALIKALPRNKTQEEALVSFFCSANDKDLPLATRAIVAYFRAAPRPTPAYTDLAVALLVSRGYDFDRKNGTYALHEAGKQLLDYIIEHPRANVIADLKVLHSNGCGPFLGELIGKHHPKLKTWEKFERKVRNAADNKRAEDPERSEVIDPPKKKVEQNGE